MTSLQLFPPLDPSPQGETPEWGTGRSGDRGNLWTPKTPNWHYVGEPTRQEYVLTKLKLSNLRLNDQLLPRPQDFDMGDDDKQPHMIQCMKDFLNEMAAGRKTLGIGINPSLPYILLSLGAQHYSSPTLKMFLNGNKIMIDKPFPAEHPYSSHIPRFAIFPKFDSPEDPKRGHDARHRAPGNSEMPSSPYNVKVLHKTKGHGHRIELQSLPPEGTKNPLEWHDGDTYEHLIKTSANNQRRFYPTPPKIYVPNNESRDNNKILLGDMTVVPRTANTLRNIERDQWETTYNRAHTGLGPANPNKLDNQDEKDAAAQIGQERSDDIYPHSTPTFDPARPVEGRIARLRDPDPQPQTSKYPNPSTDPNYVRKPTLTEIEEDRLLNGKEYVNLPERQTARQNTMDLQEEQEAMLNTTFDGYEPVTTEGHQHPLQSARDQQHNDIQQMEAENRWKVLESQTPAHNILARKHKMDLAVDKSQPDVFYQHEGKYQRERSGLYKTSYDPYKLQYDMNKGEKTGGQLFDLTGYQKDVLNQSFSLNDDMADAMRFGRSLGGPPGSVPQLHDQPTPYEAFQPYKVTREMQKATIQPQVQPADTRTVEDGLILKETTHNDGYNHQKFLQENDVLQAARKEPLVLMSNENQSLHNVKVASTPKTPRVRIEQVYTASDSNRLSSAPIGKLQNERPLVDIRPDTSPAPRPVIRTTESSARRSMSFVPSSQDRPRRTPFSSDQIQSRSSSGSTLRHSWAGESPYKSQLGSSGYLDLGYKSDSRFDWEPGCGTPRPQTSLLQIQDSFTKSSARKKFHHNFPEMNPDLRENILSGRKHNFGSMNAQVLRGTLAS